MTEFNTNNLTKFSFDNDDKETGKKMDSWAKKACSRKNMKNRFPVMKWIPSYTGYKFMRDVLAGVIVGATSVAQGIAYADIAGLPAEYGLYSGIVGGFIYFIFGNCKNMSIGPTAILSALVSRHVSGLSPEFAVLLAFLTGVLQVTLAVIQLGSLVDFFSGPVITGFTTAAAIHIASTQSKSFFGMKGNTSNSFIEAIYNFVINVTTINVWDTILGIITIFIIIMLKKLGQGCSQNDGIIKATRRFLSLIRNVIVIVFGLLLAYILFLTSNDNMLTLVGPINGGLPDFKVPAFSATVGNQTYDFSDMVQELGARSLVVPLMAIMEVVIISKAFTPDVHLDATQEIIALGLCNLVGSFFGSYTVTGAFSRSALNDASGVQTTASGVFVSLMIIFALSWGTSIFYFIPKAALAAMIIIAVYALIEPEEIVYLWKTSKKEFGVFLITLITGLCLGLEYGVIFGVIFDILLMIYKSARPSITVKNIYANGTKLVIITMPERAVFCSSEFIRKTIIRRVCSSQVPVVIIDGRNMKEMDSTVVFNIMGMVDDIGNKYQIIFLNFRAQFMKMCTELAPKHLDKFMSASSVEELLQDTLSENV